MSAELKQQIDLQNYRRIRQQKLTSARNQCLYEFARVSRVAGVKIPVFQFGKTVINESYQPDHDFEARIILEADTCLWPRAKARNTLFRDWLSGKIKY